MEMTENKHTTINETILHVSAEPRGLEMEIDREKFALALHTWRLRAGLTQVEAAKKFGVCRKSILKAENGRHINWATAYRIFAHLAQALKEEAEINMRYADAVHNDY